MVLSSLRLITMHATQLIITVSTRPSVAYDTRARTHSTIIILISVNKCQACVHTHIHTSPYKVYPLIVVDSDYYTYILFRSFSIYE